MNRKIQKLALIFQIVLFTSIASAKVLIGLGGGYQQAKNSVSAEHYDDSSVFNANVYVGITKGNGGIYVGAEYIALTVNQYVADATRLTFTNSAPYVGVRGTLLEGELLAYTFAFNPGSTANYKLTGFASEKWNGTSFVNRLTIQPELISKLPQLKVGLSLLHYYGKFTKESSLATAKFSFTQSLFLPSLEIIYKF